MNLPGPSSRVALRHAFWGSCIGAMASTGCGGAEARGPLPEYAGHGTELFENGIEPAAVGYKLGHATPPGSDSRLRERAQVADVVVHGRVVTVTSKQLESGTSWQIGFQTLEKLAGARSSPEDFTLKVEPTDPAAGIMRSFEARLVGKTVVVFLREFAPSSSAAETVVHFHVAQDDKDEIDAVRAAGRPQRSQ
jgi:hypothetical protein